MQFGLKIFFFYQNNGYFSFKNPYLQTIFLMANIAVPRIVWSKSLTVGTPEPAK